MTDQYAVFGNPIAHSKSPRIHALFAEQTGEDIEYTKQLVELGQFASEAKKFFDKGGKGLNITVPFKLDAYAFSEKNGSVSERAKLAGAVNTLKKLPDGKILGDNTDGAGLVRDITQNLGWKIKDRRILILGAGGAVRGVLGPLLEQKPKSITIRNRTREKADELKTFFFDKKIEIYVWTDGDPSNPPPELEYDLFINGTSAGFLDDNEEWFSNLSIWFAKKSKEFYAYDMMYGKERSDFLRFAEFEILHHFNWLIRPLPTPLQKFIYIILRFFARNKIKAHLADGLGMLVEQAAESFNIWRDVKPETKPVIEKVRSEL